MTTKHTPGPWKQHPNGLGGSTTMIWRNDPDQGEDTNHGYAMICKHVHGAANANLIAAAPELLEALKHAYESLYWASQALDIPEDRNCQFNDSLHMARAAIAKARGE